MRNIKELYLKKVTFTHVAHRAKSNGLVKWVPIKTHEPQTGMVVGLRQKQNGVVDSIEEGYPKWNATDHFPMLLVSLGPYKSLIFVFPENVTEVQDA